MESSIDRRIFERMQEDFTGWYTLKDNEEILGEFLGLDFSAEGLRVNSRQQLIEGRALSVSVMSPLVRTPIKEAAQVVWQREVKPGWWQAGLKFYRSDLVRMWPLVRPERYKED